MADVVVGIDVGTTGVKALAVGLAGQVYGHSQRRVKHYFPEASFAEQDPLELAGAVAQATRDACAQARARGHRLRALSLSSVMHGIFAVDDGARPLTRMLTWADARAASQADGLRREFTDLYQRTGVPVHPALPSAKLRWLREKSPKFRDAAHFVSFKQWLLFQLCGQWVEDHATASATGLFNVRTLQWDGDLLKAIGVEEQQLGELVSCSRVFMLSSDAWQQRLGLSAELPVVVGATDGLLATVGSGVFGEKMYSVTAGTSGAVRKMTSDIMLDQRERTFCYILDAAHWVTGGATNNVGVVMSWLMDHIGLPHNVESGADPTSHVLEAAAQAPAGADGLMFLPYLTGERAPYWNENAKGAFFGLQVRHTRAHLLRAGIEGTVFALRSILNLVGKSDDLDAVVVRGSGGLFRSSMWCQLVADVFAVPVEVTEQAEVSGFGAAQYGFFALGEFPRLEDVARAVRVRERFEPEPGAVQIYAHKASLFEELYRNTEGCFAALDDSQ